MEVESSFKRFGSCENPEKGGGLDDRLAEGESVDDEDGLEGLDEGP